MRFYEKLLFHILKKDGLQYTTNGDQDYEDDEGEEEEQEEANKNRLHNGYYYDISQFEFG